MENQMTPLISIIVPIYNSEKTLERCVNSILNQTYRDFELLLLDDGSTDASGRICDEYAQEDPRVHVVHKENTGVSDTRNRGIAMARGEYLQFLDADDWITPYATELFVHAVTESRCDMVIADFYRVIGERVAQKGAIEETGLIDRMVYASNMMQNPADFYYGVLWNKFYKRSVIDEYRLEMDSSVSWCEDFIFNLEYIRRIRTVYVLKVPVYYYMKTKGSLVSQGMSMKKTIQMKRMVFTYYNDFYKEVFGEEEYEKKKGQIYRFLFDAAGDGEVALSILPGNYKLGSERTSVSEQIREGEGLFFDSYRERKLRERSLEVVALKNDFTVAEVKLLYYLSMPHGSCTLKEIADILNLTRGGLNQAIQKLLSRDMIEAQEKEKKTKKGTRNKETKNKDREKERENRKKSGSWEYTVTEEANPVLAEILFVLSDFGQIQYRGFTQEEIELYEELSERRNRNIREAL